MELNSEKIDLSMEIKKKIDNLTKTHKVMYLDGNYIDFEGTNISCINPVKVIITNKGKELVLLFYGNGNTFIYMIQVINAIGRN